MELCHHHTEVGMRYMIFTAFKYIYAKLNEPQQEAEEEKICQHNINNKPSKKNKLDQQQLNKKHYFSYSYFFKVSF